MKARRLSATALPVLVLALSACSINVSAEKHVATDQRTFTVTGRPQIVLKTFDGAIEVSAWSRPDVSVTIERYAGSQAEAEALEVKVDQSGDTITIEAVRPEREVQIGFHVGRGVKLIVSTPSDSDVEANTGDGSISAAGIEGRVALSSGDGAVSGQDLAGDVNVHTGDGSVKLENVSGRLDVHTGDGSVRIGGTLQALKARTGDGSITIELAAGSTLDDDWEITTGDGSVRASIPDGINAEIDARTGDGRISADELGLSASESGRELRATLGSGGRALKIRTGDGSIRLSKG